MGFESLTHDISTIFKGPCSNENRSSIRVCYNGESIVASVFFTYLPFAFEGATNKRSWCTATARHLWCERPSHRYFCAAAESVAKFFEFLPKGIVKHLSTEVNWPEIVFPGVFRTQRSL